MRALLDVNVLIALLDADHISHSQALAWFTEYAKVGWASCPITQNGCVRIMSSPGYPNTIPVRSVIERLTGATGAPQHEFWADSVSLLDARIAEPMRIHGPRQLTDVYLLALAVSRGGRFVTFDAAIPREAAKGAERRHILVL
jgi:toxin-antitoxin system PIN domain toxin